MGVETEPVLIEHWDHAFWCLTAAFLWFGGLLPKSELGAWIPPWWGPYERRFLSPPAPPGEVKLWE